MANNPNSVKILLTGGHAHATAYALIKEIKKRHSAATIFWLGPRSLIEGKTITGVEDEVFKQLGVKVFNIDAGRVQVKLTRFTLFSILRVPVGFIQALIVVARIRPHVCVSFGGFVGLPVVIASWLFGIPVVIHEQTTKAGRGNIYASRFAKKIAVARKSSEKFFPKNKVVITGNPIDEAILSVKRRNRTTNKPVLFITGGHTGSAALNKVMLLVITELLESFYVVHQTGAVDYEKCLEFKKTLDAKTVSNYEIYDNINPRLWPKMLEKADIVVSRAGANTVSQLVALKIPCLLVPIPYTYMDEQSSNAEYAVDFGIARKLDQKNMSRVSIMREIDYLQTNWQKIVNSVKNRKSPDLDAAENFAKLIFDATKKQTIERD